MGFKVRRLERAEDHPGPHSVMPPPIKLRYGQVMWLLNELGYGAGASRNTMHEYLKALRKFGIPFGPVRFQTKHKKTIATYSYGHIMELVIVLSLRVYHVIPDSVLKGVAQHRGQLQRMFERAYIERRSGAGRPLFVAPEGDLPVELRGLYLDLDIRFSAGHLVRFGPPKLLSAIEALALFSESTLTRRTFMPMSLSLLAEQVTSLALVAPVIRSGPPKGRKVNDERRKG